MGERQNVKVAQIGPWIATCHNFVWRRLLVKPAVIAPQISTTPQSEFQLIRGSYEYSYYACTSTL